MHILYIINIYIIYFLVLPVLARWEWETRSRTNWSESLPSFLKQGHNHTLVFISNPKLCKLIKYADVNHTKNNNNHLNYSLKLFIYGQIIITLIQCECSKCECRENCQGEKTILYASVQHIYINYVLLRINYVLLIQQNWRYGFLTFTTAKIVNKGMCTTI